MTHDERISAYIDNELSAEQEQEFLISLAASDGLRKSFRSELVMKNVLHRDEMVTNPPREMRTALFATLGIGLVAGAASKADAAETTTKAASGSHAVPSHSLIKTFFATKMSALVTAAGISLSALAGYGVHSIVASDHVSPTQSATTAVSHQQQAPANPINPVAVEEPRTGNTNTTAPSTSGLQTTTNQHAAAASHRSAMLHRAIRETSTPSGTAPVSGVAGSGEMQMNPPKITHK